MSAKGGNVVPGVAGCIGISGKLCCDPGGTVVDEDILKYGHVVWTDLVVEVQSSVDEEVKENAAMNWGRNSYETTGKKFLLGCEGWEGCARSCRVSWHNGQAVLRPRMHSRR